MFGVHFFFLVLSIKHLNFRCEKCKGLLVENKLSILYARACDCSHTVFFWCGFIIARKHAYNQNEKYMFGKYLVRCCYCCCRRIAYQTQVILFFSLFSHNNSENEAEKRNREKKIVDEMHRKKLLMIKRPLNA